MAVVLQVLETLILSLIFVSVRIKLLGLNLTLSLTCVAEVCIAILIADCWGFQKFVRLSMHFQLH